MTRERVCHEVMRLLTLIPAVKSHRNPQALVAALSRMLQPYCEHVSLLDLSLIGSH